MELLSVFLHGTHKSLLLHLVGNREDFCTCHCLVAILGQEVDPSDNGVILIIGIHQLFECGILEIVCEFLYLAFFNEP